MREKNPLRGDLQYLFHIADTIKVNNPRFLPDAGWVHSCCNSDIVRNIISTYTCDNCSYKMALADMENIISMVEMVGGYR